MWNRADPAERGTSETGKRESRRANAALRDYLLMGTGRSINKLVAKYAADPAAPTKSRVTIAAWSGDFAWVARSQQFDELQQAKTRQEYDERRAAIMENGLALTHERVAKLVKLFDQLEQYAVDEERVWLKDVKSVRVGTGIEMSEDGKTREVGEYERVDLIRFNDALIGKMLETLAALAAETGGRVRKAELTGKDGGPIRTAASLVDLSKLSDAELAALEEIMEKADAGTDDPGRSAG